MYEVDISSAACKKRRCKTSSHRSEASDQFSLSFISGRQSRGRQSFSNLQENHRRCRWKCRWPQWLDSPARFSPNPRCFGDQGREFIDFGAGDGRVLLSAILGSATKASGYELPVNKAHSTILHAVLRSIEKETDSGVEFFEAAVHWIGRDINWLQSIPSCPSSQSCIYSFWVGMPFPTQEKILLLCASSQNVSALAVFRDRKWRHPDEGDFEISLNLDPWQRFQQSFLLTELCHIFRSFVVLEPRGIS